MGTLKRITRKTSGWTPWGNAQTVTNYGPGVDFYTTAGRGGFKLSDEALAKVRLIHPDHRTFRKYPKWFEEDCEWRFVALALPDYFTDSERRAAWSIHLGSIAAFKKAGKQH